MVIELKNIFKNYPNPGGGAPQRVLENLSLTLAEGESIAITGPSGSGKSTLLNIIGSLDKPDSGDVFFRSSNLKSFSNQKLAEFRNREAGFIFQMHHLLPQCTVLENVLLPTIPFPRKNREKELIERARKLLKKVGLEDKLESRPGQLSGGENQRVAFVRALINSPTLVLADEPTGSLDNQSAENLITLLLKINREEKVTTVIVTHSPAIAAKMDRVVEIKNRRFHQS